MSEIPVAESIERREDVRVVDTGGGGEQRQQVVQDVAAERQGETIRITQIVWLIFGVLNGLIALRFLLKLIAANPNTGFAQFIYGITHPFMLPFIGLTATPTGGGVVLEIPALIAILVYALLAWVIVKAIGLALYRSSARSVSVYRRD